MPLDVVRLLDSDLFALSTGEEFKAAVSLWCKSWLQVPAASLPDDDRILAALAGLGRDTKAWAKVKDMAMRGFALCSDGRWYHEVIALKALEAWQHRLKQREKSAAGNAKRWKKPSNSDPRGDANSDPRGDATRDRKGQGEGEGDIEIPGRTHTPLVHVAQVCVGSFAPVLPETGPPVPVNDDPDPPQPTASGAACLAMRAEGIADVNPASPKLATLLEAGATNAEFAAAAKAAVERGKGFAYALGTVQRQREEAAAMAASGLHKGPMPMVAAATRPQTFAEIDRENGMRRWEEMTGRVHPDRASAPSPQQPITIDSEVRHVAAIESR